MMVTDLTPADRCDRCSAQALHRIEFAAGVLDFCGHHYREHEDKLLSMTTPRLG